MSGLTTTNYPSDSKELCPDWLWSAVPVRVPHATSPDPNNPGWQ
jgi:hypothetical protein